MKKLSRLACKTTQFYLFNFSNRISAPFGERMMLLNKVKLSGVISPVTMQAAFDTNFRSHPPRKFQQGLFL